MLRHFSRALRRPPSLLRQERQRQQLGTAQHFERHFAADLVVGQCAHQIVGAGYSGAVEPHDDVAGPQAGAACGTIRFDRAGHDGTLLLQSCTTHPSR